MTHGPGSQRSSTGDRRAANAATLSFGGAGTLGLTPGFGIGYAISGTTRLSPWFRFDAGAWIVTVEALPNPVVSGTPVPSLGISAIWVGLCADIHHSARWWIAGCAHGIAGVYFGTLDGTSVIQPLFGAALGPSASVRLVGPLTLRAATRVLAATPYRQATNTSLPVGIDLFLGVGVTI